MALSHDLPPASRTQKMKTTTPTRDQRAVRHNGCGHSDSAATTRRQIKGSATPQKKSPSHEGWAINGAERELDTPF